MLEFAIGCGGYISIWSLMMFSFMSWELKSSTLKASDYLPDISGKKFLHVFLNYLLSFLWLLFALRERNISSIWVDFCWKPFILSLSRH
jgi:hypothetical protein